MPKIFILLTVFLFQLSVYAQRRWHHLYGLYDLELFCRQTQRTGCETITDAMVETGLRDLGFDHIFIDDGWQGGRDFKNNMIPTLKIPLGMRPLPIMYTPKTRKIGIYSDAAPLTCAGYTASLNFEEQDAKPLPNGDLITWSMITAMHQPTGKLLLPDTKNGEGIAKFGQRNRVWNMRKWGDRQRWLWAKSGWTTVAHYCRCKGISGQQAFNHSTTNPSCQRRRHY